MAKLSIPLTFSDDGEYIQLSRMDAAILLTWIMGGDHDESSSTPAQAPEQKEPAVATERSVTQAPPASATPTAPARPLVSRAAPTNSVGEDKSGGLPKQPPLSREPAPMSKKEAAAQVLKEPAPLSGEKSIPKVPFEVTAKSAEYANVTHEPLAQEFVEEEPYWEYSDGPAPEPKA